MRLLCVLSVLGSLGVCNGFNLQPTTTKSIAAAARAFSSPWCWMGARYKYQRVISGGSMGRSPFGCGSCSRRLASSEDDILDSIVNGGYSFDDDISEEEKIAEMNEEEIFQYFEGPEEDTEDKLELFEFVLENHKPLGCTAEESVAIEQLDQQTLTKNKELFHHVFVAKVTEGGNAEKAGLLPGDVIVGLSGTFDEVMDVIGAGLDKVRSLVAGRDEEKTLKIRVVRNSNVMSKHETTLVDLCTLDGTSQSELNDCLNTIMSNEFVEMKSADVMMEENCDNGLDDAECMLETMFESWVDEMPGVRSAEDEKKNEEEKEEQKTVAPWSSRSSPSGTYVRDPATGEMRNIDAQ